MAAQKKSISRKELLKKPDEFITTSNKIANWVTIHYQKVIWVGAVIILVAGAFLVTGPMPRARKNRAGRLISPPWNCRISTKR